MHKKAYQLNYTLRTGQLKFQMTDTLASSIVIITLKYVEINVRQGRVPDLVNSDLGDSTVQ